MNYKRQLNYSGRILLYLAFFFTYSILFAQHSPEAKAEQLLSDFITAFEKQDISLHETIWSQSDELRVIGVFENSNFFGWEEFKTHLQNTFKAAKRIEFSLLDSKITLSKDGNTGWFFMLVDETIELQVKTLTLKNMRYTGVIELRNDQWRIIQFHGSIPFND